MTSKEISKILIKCFRDGGKLLMAANGGSASQCEHMVGELLGHFRVDRKPLPAICLNSMTSTMTAIGNDYGFEYIFSRQVEALGNKGDVFVGLSTTYNSKNILEAEKQASFKGMTIIRFPLDGKDTPEIQENHLKIIHETCDLIEEAILKKEL